MYLKDEPLTAEELLRKEEDDAAWHYHTARFDAERDRVETAEAMRGKPVACAQALALGHLVRLTQGGGRA